MSQSVFLLDGKHYHSPPPIELQSPLVQYGEGCFETLKINQGQIEYWSDHLLRLSRSIAFVYGEELPQNFQSQLTEELFPWIETHASNQDFRFKLIVWKEPEIGFRYFASLTPYQSPLKPFTLGLWTDSQGWFAQELCQYKLTNYLPHRMLIRKASEVGVDDILRIDSQFTLKETSRSNLFVFHNNKLITPPGHDILPGTIRKQLLQNGKATEGLLTLEDLKHAQAVFLTNALIGVIPVESIQSISKEHPPLNLSFFIHHDLLKELRQTIGRSGERFTHR